MPPVIWYTGGMTDSTPARKVTEPTESAAPAEAKNSVSPDSAPARKNKIVKSVKAFVVSGNDTDEVLASRLAPNPKQKKSLSVVHLQRRLRDLGHTEGYYGDGDGTFGEATLRSLREWQKENGHDNTGRLTHEQITAIFEGDPNVTATVDSHEDHAV